MCRRHAVCMTLDPRWKRRAIAIEYWIASIIVGGAFVVGAWTALRYYLAQP